MFFINFIPQAHAQVSIGSNLKIGTRPVMYYLTLGEFVNPIVFSLYTLATALLVISLIFGGLMFIINAGKADKEGMEKAKTALGGTLVGFLVVFSSFWIILIVEFITGINIIKSRL